MIRSNLGVCLPMLWVLNACAHPGPRAEPASPGSNPTNETPLAVAVSAESPPELAVVQKVDEKIPAPAAGVHLLVQVSPDVFDAAGVRELTERLKASLARRRYEARAVSAGAPSQLLVTSFEDQARDARGIAIVWGVRRSGRRPVRWIQQAFTVRGPIAPVWPKLRQRVAESFDALELPPPAPPAGPTADPTCAPRFGFDTDERNVVTAVSRGSPAQRADVRVGDVVLAVDSRPPAWDRADVTPDVYLQRLSVPLKLDRRGTIVRGQVRAEVLCE